MHACRSARKIANVVDAERIDARRDGKIMLNALTHPLYVSLSVFRHGGSHFSLSILARDEESERERERCLRSL